MSEQALLIIQLDRIEAKIDKQDEKLDTFVQRLVVVETHQKTARMVVGWVAGIVATLVTTVILWLVALFGGRG